MGKWIDADALKEWAEVVPLTPDGGIDANDLAKKIESMPTADVAPVRHGEWIYGEDEFGIDGYHCDKCGFFVPWDYASKHISYIKDYHYCPNCGAKMDGGDVDAD